MHDARSIKISTQWCQIHQNVIKITLGLDARNGCKSRKTTFCVFWLFTPLYRRFRLSRVCQTIDLEEIYGLVSTILNFTPCGSVFGRFSVPHNRHRESIENLWNVYRTSIEHLSNIYRTSMDLGWIWVDLGWILGGPWVDLGWILGGPWGILSRWRAWRNLLKIPLNIYRISIEHLSKIGGTSKLLKNTKNYVSCLFAFLPPYIGVSGSLTYLKR